MTNKMTSKMTSKKGDKQKKTRSLKKTPNLKGSLLWAVVPEPEGPQVFETVSSIVKYISAVWHKPITPVSVVTSRQAEIWINYFRPELWDYRLAVKEMIGSLLARVGIEGASEPVILNSEQAGRRAVVKKLATYASRSGVSLIVLNSHSRKGMAGWFLGSFTEGLAQTSRVPLLVVPPGARWEGKVQKVLFPTDFGKTAARSFSSLIPFLRSCGARVTILHQLDFPLIPLSEYDEFRMPDGQLALKEYVAEEHKRLAKTIDSWRQILAKNGLEGEVLIEDRLQAASETILEFADKNQSDMIAMPSHSGAAAAVLLGSVAQQVLRRSRVPVWVVHTKK